MEMFEDISAITPAAEPAALTIGKFEGVHLGHQRLFHRLAGHADQHGLVATVVSFLNDPKDITGAPDHIEKMIYPLSDRVEFMRACGIERVLFVPFNESVAVLTANSFVNDFILATMRAAYFACGEDFRFGQNAAGDAGLAQDLCRAGDCIAEIEPHFTVNDEKVSSTAICRLILAGEFQRASALLGRTYCIEGKVAPGRGIGRQLGFPTLNIHYPDEVLVPEGIFAGWVDIRGERYPAAVNSGRRPTIEPLGRNMIEIHILSEPVPDNVGAVRLYPEVKIRNEHKFESHHELTEAIADDCEKVRQILGVEIEK